MIENIPAKIFKCQINHEGDKTNFSLWAKPETVNYRGSLLIIHDLGENLSAYKDAIKKLCEAEFKVYGFNLKSGSEKIHGENPFPGNFREFSVEILQIIAYIKQIEGGTPPILLTQGLGSLIGLITTRKHPTFVRGFIACSPMFQLTEKIIPLKRLTIRTLSDFMPEFILPRKISPKFTSNRKLVEDGEVLKYEPRVSSREAHKYLKAMSQARKNFAKITKRTLLICPDHNEVHKYSFLKKAISKHKYEDHIDFINLHTKYHAIASDRSQVLETYEKYIIPWITKLVEQKTQSKSEEN